jgi:hypothetical protein
MSESTWLSVCASVRGTSHETNGLPCQDFVSIEGVGPAGDILIVALSDGAGSALHAEKGARIVVQEWIAFFKEILNDNPDPASVLSEIDKADIETIIQNIQKCIAEAADRYQSDVTEFSATLIGAVVYEGGGLVAQVGDGCWVLRSNSTIGCVTWPEVGEFVGQTVFATSKSAVKFIQMAQLPLNLDMLVGFTDGVERLALDIAAKSPSPAFFLPLARGLKELGPDSENALRAFLESDRVCSATDDDKSIAAIIKVDANF